MSMLNKDEGKMTRSTDQRGNSFEEAVQAIPPGRYRHLRAICMK